jgi:ParB family chromosome partitioning protein
MPFERRQVSLPAVDVADETFRLGRPRDVELLAGSIERLGLLCAPIVAILNGRWVVVSGFGRVAACRRLGWPEMPARLPRDPVDAWRCAQWAVAEKAAQRSLNALETGMALRLFRRFASSEHAFHQAVRDFGLPDQPAAQARLESLCELPPEIQVAVNDETLAVSTAVSLARMEQATAVRVAGLLAGLRFSRNKQREIVTLLEEIGRREEIPVQSVLETPELEALAADVDSDRAQRGHRLRLYLHQRRFPALAKAQRRFEALNRELVLAGTARLTAPPGFESSSFQLTLSFSNRSELSRHQETIQRILSHSELDELFRLA